MLNRILTGIFGSRNERLLRQMNKTVLKINAFEAGLKALSDADLAAKTAEFKQRLGKGETLEQILPEAFAVVREASLRVLGLRHKGPVMIACPSCGRTNVDVLDLAERVEERLAGYDEVFEVAVMGCAVNGPGEAGDADFGIAGGRDAGFIYAHGEVLRKVTQTALVDELFAEIDAWIAAGMVRPERKTRKLSLPVVAGGAR